MVKENFWKKINKDMFLHVLASLVSLIFLVSFVMTFFHKDTNNDYGISEVPFAIHALEPANYNDELIASRFPGVKLSILWEILSDQNLSPEEVERRIKLLEEQLSRSVTERNTNTGGDEYSDNITESEPTDNKPTSTPNPLMVTSQPTVATLSLFGPNPFKTSIGMTATVVNGVVTPTIAPFATKTAQRTPTSSLTPTMTLSQTYLATPTITVTPTLTYSPTSTSTVIWYPTFTNTSLPTKTPLPPTNTPSKTNTPIPPTHTPSRTNTPVPPTQTFTPTYSPIPPTNTPTNTSIPPTLTPTPTQTNTPTHTSTPTSTQTYTPTNTPVPPTLTPTLAICNVDPGAKQISVSFTPPNGSTNISVNIQPVIKFNQSMDPSSFIVGRNGFTIAFCEFDNLNTCPPPKVLEFSLAFHNDIYPNDTVIIIPNQALNHDTSYLIFIGAGIRPDPVCSVYSDPISIQIISKFTTLN